MDTNKVMISLCLTTYNRTELLFDSFRQVINDDRVSEIIIVDDHSEQQIFHDVKWFTKDIPKVKLFRNDSNIDCYRNKKEAASKSSNEWLIIGDSDNIFTKAYIDRIESLFVSGLNQKTVYQPSFAKPHFNFTKYEGMIIDKFNVAKYMEDPTFQTMLNAMNYFVNRDEFLKVWDGSVDPVTSDSIFHNYNWLKAENKIYVVSELHYEHRVHEESHYRNNVRRTPRGFHEEIVRRINQL